MILSYVTYELINVRIQRRLMQEMPDEDDEREEGGAGGSRIGTLLLLYNEVATCTPFYQKLQRTPAYALVLS